MLLVSQFLLPSTLLVRLSPPLLEGGISGFSSCSQVPGASMVNFQALWRMYSAILLPASVLSHWGWAPVVGAANGIILKTNVNKFQMTP